MSTPGCKFVLWDQQVLLQNSSPLHVTKGRAVANTTWQWCHCRSCHNEIEYNVNCLWDSGYRFYPQGLLSKIFLWLGFVSKQQRIEISFRWTGLPGYKSSIYRSFLSFFHKLYFQDYDFSEFQPEGILIFKHFNIKIYVFWDYDPKLYFVLEILYRLSLIIS